MDKYIELFGKKYLRCTACSHCDKNKMVCKMFNVACTKDDGCTEEHIKEEEIKYINCYQ
jgi:multimeric flavodoxin WrbA